MKTWHHWKLTLRVRSPFLFAALEPGPDGFDATAMRTPDGLSLIPGDHIRGHIRHAIRILDDDCLDSLFGKASVQRDDAKASVQDAPLAGALVFSDAIATQFSHQSGQSFEFPRIAIDEATGTVRTGALNFIELVAPPDTIVEFNSVVSYLASSHEGSNKVKELLEDALLVVTSMGGLKSSGFGELVHPLPKLEVLKLPSLGLNATQTSLTVEFDRPLLVDTRHAAWNAIEGAAVVPGGAIKGALGRLISGDTNLSNALSQILISHAFPLDDQEVTCDLPIPLAFAFSNETRGIVLDDESLVALCADEVPIFQPDWKERLWEEARSLVKRPASNLTYQSRGHVAIDDNGIAAEGQLFVTRHVETKGKRWQLSIERNGADEAKFQEILNLVSQGLPAIGRTGAIMSVVRTNTRHAISKATKNKELLLILETPALLTNVLNHQKSATAQYQAYFELLLGKDGFSDFKAVAQRSLKGDYLAHRFRLYGSERYVPFEITNPGAVFALTCTSDDGVALLNQALETGLPPTNGEALLTNAMEDWQSCPFMNQNGFGQISNVSHWLKKFKVWAEL
jgi:RAMP superfamily